MSCDGPECLPTDSHHDIRARSITTLWAPIPDSLFSYPVGLIPHIAQSWSKTRIRSLRDLYADCYGLCNVIYILNV